MDTNYTSIIVSFLTKRIGIQFTNENWEKYNTIIYSLLSIVGFNFVTQKKRRKL